MLTLIEAFSHAKFSIFIFALSLFCWCANLTLKGYLTSLKVLKYQEKTWKKKIITSFLHNWVSIAEKGSMKNYTAPCTRDCGETRERKFLLPWNRTAKKRKFTLTLKECESESKSCKMKLLCNGLLDASFYLAFCSCFEVKKKLCNKTFHQEFHLTYIKTRKYEMKIFASTFFLFEKTFQFVSIPNARPRQEYC